MRNLTFTYVNTKSYNTFMCIVIPLVTLTCIAEYIPTILNRFTLQWFFSVDFLRFILVTGSYSIPLTYLLSKAYELADLNAEKNVHNKLFGTISCSFLLLPLFFIGLAMLAKITFLIPLAFTASIVFIYLKSYKLTRNHIK